MFPLLGGLISGAMGMFSANRSAEQSGQNTQATIAANQASQQETETFNAGEAQKNRDFQSGQVLQQENFQKEMSGTAYQRASADMKSAGLNPMMMFGSGGPASSPSGSAAGGSTASVSPMKYDYSGRTSAASAVASELQKAIPSAVALKTADATIDNLVAQNAKIQAETLTEQQRPSEVVARTGQASTSSRANVEHAEKMSAERRNVEAQLPFIVDTSQSAKNRMQINSTVRRVLDQSAFGGSKVNDTIAPVANLVSSAKGVRSLIPERSTIERATQTHRGGSSTFEERFTGGY